jgi:hypothetical protein
MQQFCQKTSRKERSLGRPRHRWEDNIKTDLRDRGCGLDSAVSGYNPVVNSCEHGNKPSFIIKESEKSFDQLSKYQVFKDTAVWTLQPLLRSEALCIWVSVLKGTHWS